MVVLLGWFFLGISLGNMVYGFWITHKSRALLHDAGIHLDHAKKLSDALCEEVGDAINHVSRIDIRKKE